MRWSLITIVAIAAFTLPLYPRVDGKRVVRDDSNEGGSPSWFKNLLNTILGTDDDGEGDSEEEEDGEEMTTTMMTTTTTLPSGKIELVDLDDMNLDANGTDVENSTPTTPKTPVTTMYDETEGLSKGNEATETSTSPSSPSPSSTTRNPECIKPNDMTTYCELSANFTMYMHGNTTADALAQKLFSPTVINLLLEKCPEGEWCLDNTYIDAFSNSMDDIFRGPLCSEGLLECAELMLTMRRGCPDMLWLSAFEDALSSLVCEMNALPGLTTKCFGHTLATLHVTLADEIRQASKELNFGNEFCLGSYVGMTRKYMCTLEKCPNHEKLFKNYQPWQWFMDEEFIIKDLCNITTVCGDKELQAEKAESTTPGFTTMTAASTASEYPTKQSGLSEDVDKAGKDKQPQQDKPIFIIQASDESTRLLIGIITGSIIAVLGLMVLICAVFKRMRRKARGLTKEGYSKLPTDDMN